MYRTLLCALFLTAAKADETCFEESSLLQEANKPVKPNKKDSKPLAGLLESARGFLTNGVTSDVVTFAEATLAEVNNTIIPTLVSESEADQTWIQTERARFQTVLDDLVISNRMVHDLNTIEKDSSVAHKNCRDLEKIACDQKRDCEMELYRLWQVWVQEESELQGIHAHIENHFCLQDEHGNFIANGTQNTFRVASEPWMRSYTTQKAECDTAEENYDNQVPLCTTKNGNLNTQTEECDANLETLEGNACSHNSAIIQDLNLFHAAWASLHASYQGITDLVYNQTQDRHREYKTLVIIQCLLDRVHELNGRPCDEESGSVDDEMTHCEQHGEELTICTEQPALCPEYPPPPPTPPNCADRDSVIGSCLPVPQPNPCSEQWINAEMDPLPALPQPDFTEQNPGCNAYPDCTECSPPQSLHIAFYQTWVTPPDSFTLQHATFDATAENYAHRNTLWGATMDGCPSDNINSHDYEGDHTGLEIPLVVHTTDRVHDETAAVRCCSEDASGNLQCASTIQGICHNAATFLDAHAICREAGMRVCSQAETQSNACCGTGCWFNHFAVWISDGVPGED